jgi:hypothetical protein
VTGSGAGRVRGGLGDEAQQDDQAVHLANHRDNRVEVGRRRLAEVEFISAGL